MKKSICSLAAVFGAGVVFAAPGYFRAEDAKDYEAAVGSITDVMDGRLYTMKWQGDYHLDRVLDSGCRDVMSSVRFFCTDILDNAPMPKIVTGFGCSAFAATNVAGKVIVGRNFDYAFPMAHLLLFVPKAAGNGRKYASVGTVDAGFAGFDVGAFTNVTDRSRADYPWHAALFPYYCMDGMNESGFMITILSLDCRPAPAPSTEQFLPERRNVTPSIAIRCLLDRAGSTAEAVEMLGKFNMFHSSGKGVPKQANYHFMLSDAKGDTRVVEWTPPAKPGDSWTMFVTNASEVTNFYLADGYGHGRNRWEILRNALDLRRYSVEEDEAMSILRVASQRRGAAQTSWTHWSVVYNLTDLTANIAILGDYRRIYPYRLAPPTDGKCAW